MATRADRIELLKVSLKNRILCLDGATGTAMQDMELTAKDFGGEELDGCNENLVITRPDAVKQVHLTYLEAGSDIIETNSFGGADFVLEEYGLGAKCYEMNKISAEIAREAADEFTAKTPDKPRFVAGSMGPTTKAITVTGGISFDDLISAYVEYARGLFDGGIDYFLLETCNDTRNVKAAIIACQQVMKEAEEEIPIAISATIESTGTMLAGQGIEAFWTSISHIDPLYIGLNCATGPEFMTEHIRSLAGLATTNIACVPNAGFPDEEGNYLETPEMMSKIVSRFVEEGWINVVGGCCGTTPEHIKAFTELVKDKEPRVFSKKNNGSFLSGVDFLEITDEQRPILVGERTNVIGSKKFKTLITDEKFDEAAEIAKGQAKKGAQILDVCLANPDREELEDMEKFLDKVIQKIKLPLMIDSTDEKVVEESLKYSQGKAIINSINLEDGLERFDAIVPLARKFGAALVIGTIDEDPEKGMAVSRERKLEVAERSYNILKDDYGVAPEDMYFDPLVFPCATGDENYIGSAVETIEGIRLIKEKFPKCKTVIGLSNISFGLPSAGREVLNSVFLYHCTQAGLDLALVNTQGIKRFSSLKQEEIDLAEDLLWNKGEDPIAAFAAFYRGKKKEKTVVSENLSVEERLANYILEGVKKNLIKDLDIMREKLPPMEVINGPLMEGMKEVGRLFNANKLIVAEVLQSAEVMKEAVNYLESFMEKGDSSNKGTIVLATVKGDVHDIGKNLVDIVLSNNGFNVINLGIKIPPDKLIAAVKEHKPDMLGLSGLLVKSAQMMTITASDFVKSGIDVPILVGGAALSQRFANTKISPAYENGNIMYAKDAMDGLRLANLVLNKEAMAAEIDRQRSIALNNTTSKSTEVLPDETTIRSTKVSTLTQEEIALPPDYKRHVLKNSPMEIIWKFTNYKMLFGKHLGIKGSLVNYLINRNFFELESLEGGQKAVDIFKEVELVKLAYKDMILKPSAVYQFCRATSTGNTINFSVENEFGDLTDHSYTFPRQRKEDGLCLADYVASKESGLEDNICQFVVTVGKGVSKEASRLKDDGQYLRSHILSALALESAEAYAEYLHKLIRGYWGNSDPDNLTKLELFQAKYKGTRFSFGYPACPDLEDQETLFKALKPSSDVGVELTDGFMMDPEASVSAIVFHHPDSRYFVTKAASNDE